MPKRTYTIEERELALQVLAYCAGNAERASNMLKQRDVPLRVPPGTLRAWRTGTHSQRYDEIAHEQQQSVAQRAAAEAEEVVERATRIEHALLDRIEQKLESGDDVSLQEATNALRNVTTTTALKMDKVANPLRGRPTVHVQPETAEQILRRIAPYFKRDHVEGTAVELPERT